MEDQERFSSVRDTTIPQDISVRFCDTQMPKVEHHEGSRGCGEQKEYSIKITVEEDIPVQSRDLVEPQEACMVAAQTIPATRSDAFPSSIAIFSPEVIKDNRDEAHDKNRSDQSMDSQNCTELEQEKVWNEPTDQPSKSWKDMRDHCMNYPSDLPLDSSNSAAFGSSPEASIYQIKWIFFQGSQCGIVCQNKNGPCPLISIVNVLLLTKRLTLQQGIEYQSGENLLSQLAMLILESVPEKAAEDVMRNYEQNIQDALAILPKLQTGIDINVKFAGPHQYEFTQETLLFDILDVPLVHGWIVDKSDPAKAVMEKYASYNTTVEFVINGKASEDLEVVQNALLAEDWLDKSQSQLTYAGLIALADGLTNDTPCVLFRNNHFSTIVRHADQIYLLVTDQGYATESSCVWEQLANIEGDTDFFDDHFCRRVSHNKLDAAQQMELDRQLALSLSQDQDVQVVVSPGYNLLDSTVFSDYAVDPEALRAGKDNTEVQYGAKRQNVPPSQSAYQLNEIRQRVVPVTSAANSGNMPSYERRYESDHNLVTAGDQPARTSQSASIAVQHRRLPQHTSAPNSDRNKKDKCTIS